jgi:UDP-N-acetylglucosamine 3-dehydrogenase
VTRLGLIGCGTVARRTHLPAIAKLDDVTVVGCASRSFESARAASLEAPGSIVFEDWRELITFDIDAVVICSPNGAHAEQAIAAAQAGKHVLVEKPIARTVDEADAMVSAAEEAGVVLHVTQNLRYLAPIVAARGVVASGALGQISGLRSAFGHGGPQHWAPDATWFRDKESSGGGALVDLGIHIIDLVNYVTGLAADEVTALTTGDGQVEDAAQVLVRFDGGVLGSVHASWVAQPAPDLQLTIFGSEGTMHFDTRSPLTLRRSDGSKEEIELPTIDASPWSDFVRAIDGSEPDGPSATGRDGRNAIAIVCAAYESAATGVAVQL